MAQAVVAFWVERGKRLRQQVVQMEWIGERNFTVRKLLPRCSGHFPLLCWGTISELQQDNEKHPAAASEFRGQMRLPQIRTSPNAAVE